MGTSYDRVPDHFPILRGHGLALRELCEDERVEAVVFAHNARVIRVLAKLGFARQPEVPPGRGVAGADSDSLLFVLLRPCELRREHHESPGDLDEEE